jgi:hypothetical protein
MLIVLKIAQTQCNEISRNIVFVESKKAANSFRYCKRYNEYANLSNAINRLNLTEIELIDWSLLAVVREPVDRFLSAYLDKCIR